MSKYQVVVGNVGTIYDGDLHEAAVYQFITAKSASIIEYGRYARESVVMFDDGELVREYHGADAE